MLVELEVHNPKVESELSVHGTEFFHIGCGPVSQRREMETDGHLLSCACGVEVWFEKNGAASSTIIDVTIDDQPRDLPSGSYSSAPEATVRIVSRATA